MKRENREHFTCRLTKPLKKDIHDVAKKEKVTATEVAESWLLVGQKEYRKNDK